MMREVSADLLHEEVEDEESRKKRRIYMSDLYETSFPLVGNLII
jgi:hypothetical protein